MNSSNQPAQAGGSLRLFQAFGINVYVHWTWFVLAFILFNFGAFRQEPLLFAAVYLSLFGIVLLHEFGHALACRSVRGRADYIVLWPLGGIAFVQPPPRPGATLWTIAAGPLVNVALVPVTLVVWFLAGAPTELHQGAGLLGFYAALLVTMNMALLVFNMLPIYPLDGGQILQAILWFFIGRGRALVVAAGVGLAGAAGGVLYAVVTLSIWIAVLSAFVGLQAWAGMRMGRMMVQQETQHRNLWRV